jgi:hypothetical protein
MLCMLRISIQAKSCWLSLAHEIEKRQKNFDFFVMRQFLSGCYIRLIAEPAACGAGRKNETVYGAEGDDQGPANPEKKICI